MSLSAFRPRPAVGLFLATCLLLACAAAARPAPPVAAKASVDAAARAARNRLLVRELVRLDERLSLDTFPDGTGRWLGRLVASLESRLDRHPEAPEASLLRHLAGRLRDLGVEEDLDRPHRGPGTGPRDRSATQDPRRDELLDRLLTTVRLLADKLDRADAAAVVDGNRTATYVAPANDDCAAASMLTDGTVSGSTDGASPDGAASCDGPGSTPDVWFRYTASTDGPIAFDSFGSAFDTVLSVFDGCPGLAGTTELACNDDADGTVQSRVMLDMTSGEEVWVRLGGFGGASGAYELSAGPDVGIAGTVTRADTGAGLPGVRVGLYFGLRIGIFTDETTTDADGTYRFSGVADTTFYVRTLDPPGFVNQIYDDVPCYSPASCRASDGTPIVVEGAEVTGVDFSLAPAAVVTGTLTDALTADPISGYVELHSSAGDYLTKTSADASGQYAFDSLPAGTYHLLTDTFMHQDEIYDDHPCLRSSCDVTTGDPVTVSSGSTTTGIDFVLDRPGSLSGTITEDPGGAPLSAGVELFDTSGDYVGRGYSDGDGHYTVGGLEAASYFALTDSRDFLDELYDDLPCEGACDVTAGTPVPVAVNGDTGGIDFALRRLGIVTGTVRDAVTGAPLESVRITLYDADGQARTYAHSDSQGRYTVTSLEPGNYFALSDHDLYALYAGQLYDGLPCLTSCTVTDGTPIPVALGTTTPNIDFSLQRLGVLSGTVRFADTTAGGLVEAYDGGGTRVAYAHPYMGHYAIYGLLPGTYYVKTKAKDYLQDELYDDVPCRPSCDLASGTPVAVGLGETVSGLDFLLRVCPEGTPSYAHEVATTFLVTQVVEACEDVTAGNGTTVASGADVTFRAGHAIVLEDGFSVRDGGSLRAVIEPAWLEELIP